ncbi:hypothetical protein ACSHWB_42950 [Lentzea sp. HUAS TT2]|uniref:hypothetical protein n=1 Tax=Lentzea sp. HUAS TT2 TaxID=3447454 RepID=UPI003F727176
MRITRYVLGALAVATTLALAHDSAGNIAVAGTPVPLSAESMRALADEGCRRPDGFRFSVLQRLRSAVVEVGVTDSQFIVCTVQPQEQSVSTSEVRAPGADYFAGRVGLVTDGETVELGRIGPEVARFEFVMPDGEVFPAELHGETYLCRIPHKITAVRVRAYDAGGRLLRDAVI